MRTVAGAVLLTLPFVGIFVVVAVSHSVVTALAAFGITAVILGVIMLGVALLDS